MNRGILIFAFQSEFDYINLAVKFVKRLAQYIDLPVSVVTDSKEILEKTGMFDKVIESHDNTTQQKRFYNGSTDYKLNTWKNSNRSLSYELTPYDHTLVLDIDYVVNSDFLLKCFDINSDFLIFKDSCDLAGLRSGKEFQYINQFSIPFYWATVFCFKKTEKNRLFFNLVKYIKDNWDYYQILYQIVESNFRNDYAFSIAINIFGEQFKTNYPGKMYYVRDRDVLLTLDETSCLFLVEKAECHNEYIPAKVSNLDVHVMNKYSLMEVL